MWCLYKHHFLVNWNNEIIYSSEGDGIFLMQIKVRDEKESGNNVIAVLNYITILENESAKIMYFDIKTIFLWLVPMNKYYSYRKQRYRVQCPRICSRCKQGSNYIWKYLIQIDFIVRVYLVFCVLETFLETPIWIK